MPASKPAPALRDLAVTLDGALAPVLSLAASSADAQPVSVTQLQVLRVLDQHGPVRLKRLAALLGATPPSTSRLCDRLEAGALVVRQHESHDRRSVVIALTPGGTRIVRQLEQTRIDALALALGRISAAEQKALFKGLAALGLSMGGAAAG